MALRLIQVLLSGENADRVQKTLEEEKKCQCLGMWQQPLAKEQTLVSVLVSVEETEAAMDVLDRKLSGDPAFRLILLPVEASLPRPEDGGKETEPPPAEQELNKGKRISREELYADIQDSSKLSRVYIITVVLSSIVAAIGLLNNNVAVIIGAMVIAPLLGSNMALSLATTLGDFPLARKALKTGLLGILLAILLSTLTGFMIQVDPHIREISSRTHVGMGDIVLGLAAGIAGALAFTTGIPTTLIGVMVSVALLPPLVAFGLLMGSGYGEAAWGAMLLFLTNMICVNLAGVIAFLVQGVRPATWWEEERAKRATRTAILLWVVLLSALIVVIFLAGRR